MKNQVDDWLKEKKEEHGWDNELAKRIYLNVKILEKVAFDLNHSYNIRVKARRSLNMIGYIVR